MSFQVRLTRAAETDLTRLFDFVLKRELARDGDLALADRAITAIRAGVATVMSSPFTCRKAARSPWLREFVISSGSTGYIALFEIVNQREVIVAAVRHQREDDFH